MSEAAASVNDLVRASLRMRAMFLLTLCTLVMLVAFCLWALHGLIYQAEIDVRSQFQHLTFDLLEQEDFLNGLIEPGTDAQVSAESVDLHPQRVDLLGSFNGVDYYFGQRGRAGLPFIVSRATDVNDSISSLSEGLSRLAEIFARHFGQARGGRVSQGSQAFLIDLDGTVDITVPCLPNSVSSRLKNVPGPKCSIPIDVIRNQLRKDYSHGLQGLPIHWRSIDVHGQHFRGAGMLLYRGIEVDDGLWSGSPVPRRLVAGTYLELTPTHAIALASDRTMLLALRKKQESLHKHEAAPHAVHSDVIDSAYEFRIDGLQFSVSSSAGWDAVYFLPWVGFFQAAPWQLFAFLLLIPLSLAGSVVLYRRHRQLVVIPAKQSHEVIVESEAFSRSVIDASKVAVVGLDVESRGIVVRNRLASEWLGRDEDIQLLMSAYVFENACDGDEFLSDRQVLLVGERYLSVSYGRTAYHGSEVLLAAFSDVTGHQQVNAALAAAKQTADDANAGKTVFLATMSHEIRTPLYGILGTIELLGLTDMSAQQRAYLHTIQSSSAGLLNIISDILDVSKIESRQMSLKLAEFDPIQLTEEVARTYAANADAKGLQLYIIVAADVPRRVLGDEPRIKQVLNNLVSNAIKFSEAGWVRLMLEIDRDSGSEGAFAWKVTDTGLGISELHAQSLFEPFYQVQCTQQVTPGTGLGLYICRSLCDLMLGEIRVDTVPGRGSTFSILLPLEVPDDVSSISESAILSGVSVWVRAPIGELAQNVGAWLRRAGAKLRTEAGAFTSDSHGGVLVEVSPNRMPPVDWEGPRVSCTPEGPEFPQWGMSGVHVNEYALRSITVAVAMAQQRISQGEHGFAVAEGGIGDAAVAGGVAGFSDRYRPAIGLDRLGLRVLVAEDNAVNRSLLVKQLEQLGCTVSTCSDGMEVISRWGEEDFDVLLTDINMPHLDGYEVVRRLREQGAIVPIIGITASTMQSERELGLALGLDAWVTKPIDLVTLYDVLRHACAGQGALLSPGTATPSPLDWQAGEEFSEHLRSVFKETMRSDVPLAWTALSTSDTEGLVSALHRMRGALAVMKFDELASFSGVLEARISVDGLTPVLCKAARSTLQEIQAVSDGMA